MPPLDWGRIMGADLEALLEDLDAADEMYGVLEMVNYKHLHRYLLLDSRIWKILSQCYYIKTQGFS